MVLIEAATLPAMRRITTICEDSGMPYQNVLSMGEILLEKLNTEPPLDINYEDLLTRPPVHLDIAGIEEFLKGRKILVTGAGGSIGSELCRQLIRFLPTKIILVDAGEANLYSIQMKLRHELHFDACPVILSRVQDQEMMETVFDEHRPEVIFHAAACKHVPMLECNPWEAVFSNVIGSRVIMKMAEKYHSTDFVLVSTDKAVRPASVMGTTKRIAELSMLSMKGNGTRFTAVRFGNVLASSGSVIPLFKRQIECGGPVTVCHPEITRYFMTIPEAAQLILQAGAQGEDGEISVLEMGTPVRIADMAADLIRLCGKEPGKDIQIVFIGLRPGEKLHEELIMENEDFERSGHEKIIVVKSNGRWNWNGFETQVCFREWLDNAVEELGRAAQSHDSIAIKKILQMIVPEYSSQVITRQAKP
jgi:FlaA1/EpsC-like NDP-sugar epimerase